MKYFAILSFLLLLLPTAAGAADLTVTYKVLKGKGKGEEKIMYWSDKYSLTVEKATKQDALTDYDKGIIYIIDHPNKTIEFIKMDEMANMMGSSSGMMGEMMNMDMPGKKRGTVGEEMQKSSNKMLGDPESAQLEKLGVLQIAGRSCDHYQVVRKGKAMAMTEEVCIDTTLHPPMPPIPNAERMMAAADEMKGMFEGLQSAGQKELQKIKGTTLKRRYKSGTRGMASVMSFGMGKSETIEEATEVKEGPIDVAIFKMPTGYKMVDKMKAMQEEMQKAQEQMGEMMKGNK